MPKSSLPQPTGSYVQTLYTRLAGIWQGTHYHWAYQIDPWIHKNVEIWPENLRTVRGKYIPSTARGIIDHATDTQLSFIPTIHRPPVGRGEDHQKEADSVEKAVLAIFMNSQLKGADITFKQGGKHMNMYGYEVLYGPYLDEEEAPEEPTTDEYPDSEEFRWAKVDYDNAKRNWNPIRFDAPHPSRVLMDPYGGRRPPEAVHRKRMWRGEIGKYLENKRGQEIPELFIATDFNAGEPSSYYDSMFVLEYWSKEWHALVGDGGDLLMSEKNAWGYQPYAQAFSGFGVEKTNQEQANPQFLCAGLLDAILDDLKIEAQNETSKHHAVIESIWRRRGSRKDTAEANAQLDREDSTLHGEPSDFWFDDYPDVGRWVFQSGAEVRTAVEWGTYNRSSAGTRQQGVSTVGQQAILSVAATRKFASVAQQQDQLATDMVQHMLMLADRLGEDISIGGAVLKVKDIHHDYTIQANFDLLDPIIQLQQRELGLREAQMGIKSHETYREGDARMGNESLERDRLLKQIVRQHPAVIEAMALAVAEEDGLAELIAEFTAKQAGAQGGGGNTLLGPGGQPIRTSDAAGGGATRALREGLTGDVAKPAPVDLAGISMDRQL